MYIYVQCVCVHDKKVYTVYVQCIRIHTLYESVLYTVYTVYVYVHYKKVYTLSPLPHMCVRTVYT